jgi:hypothetical protein
MAHPAAFADVPPLGHEVTEARDRWWDRVSNGELLKFAEEAGFDLLLTRKKEFRYQQNLLERRVAIVVLGNSSWPLVRLYLDRISAVVDAATRPLPDSRGFR